MNTYAIIFLLLICYWKIKNSFNARLTIDFQYKIYDLRDKLREYTVMGKINKYDWQFKYLDESLTNFATELNNLNLFTSIMLSLRLNKTHKSFKSDKIKIVKGMAENQYTNILYDEYSTLLIHYVLRKAFFFRFSVLVSILSSIIGKSLVERYKRWMKRVLSNIKFFPEDSQDYNLSC
jgi:hypothetical protein